jgi:hypothetical protein
LSYRTGGEINNFERGKNLILRIGDYEIGVFAHDLAYYPLFGKESHLVGQVASHFQKMQAHPTIQDLPPPYATTRRKTAGKAILTTMNPRLPPSRKHSFS